MSIRQAVVVFLAVAATIGAIVGFAMHRTEQLREPVAAPAPPADVPEVAEPIAEAPPAAEPTPPAPAPALSDAEWTARYEQSRRAMAQREAREARVAEARAAAWERQEREMRVAAQARPSAAPARTPTSEEKAPEPEKKKPARVLYVFTTWCPHCDRMLPVVEEMSRRRGVSVTAICADSEEAFEEWRKDNRPPFRVRRMSKADAIKEAERFGGSYSGPVPFLAVKSGSLLVYNKSGAPTPASATLDRLADYL